MSTLARSYRFVLARIDESEARGCMTAIALHTRHLLAGMGR